MARIGLAAMLLALLGMMNFVVAHPGEPLGENEARAITYHASVAGRYRRALDACGNSTAVAASRERALARRTAVYAQIQKGEYMIYPSLPSPYHPIFIYFLRRRALTVRWC